MFEFVDLIQGRYYKECEYFSEYTWSFLKLGLQFVLCLFKIIYLNTIFQFVKKRNFFNISCSKKWFINYAWEITYLSLFLTFAVGSHCRKYYHYAKNKKINISKFSSNLKFCCTINGFCTFYFLAVFFIYIMVTTHFRTCIA